MRLASCLAHQCHEALQELVTSCAPMCYPKAFSENSFDHAASKTLSEHVKAGVLSMHRITLLLKALV